MEGEVLKAGQFTNINTGDEYDVFGLDSLHLRKIIPEEIWKLVTEKFLKKIPDNFESLANSSPFFRKLLASQKTVHLFEKSFNLVASFTWEKDGYEGLPVSEVLKCRVVCSKWSNAIDQLIPQKFKDFGEKASNSQNILVRAHFQNILENCFTNSLHSHDNQLKVRRFLRHFERTHSTSSRNPLIWRDLHIQIITPPDNLEQEIQIYLVYLEDLTTLFSKYGRHLHEFSLDIDKHDNFEEASILQEWFSYLPNVNVLIFESDWWGNYIFNQEFYHENFIFPKLTNLHTLDVKGLPDPVFNRLVMTNHHISTLKLSFWHEDYRFYKFALPNLKNLEIEFEKPEIIERLGASQVQWPLEKLNLTFSENDDEDNRPFFFSRGFEDFSDLFRVIENKFSLTLVYLNLNLFFEDYESTDAIFEELKNGRFNMPNLRKLKLNVGRALVSLDFLLPMKHNLEEISVFVGYKYPVVETDTETTARTSVQFIGFEDKMLESNIWTYLEKLKKVKVTARWVGEEYCQPKLYFREDWMKNGLESDGV